MGASPSRAGRKFRTIPCPKVALEVESAYFGNRDGEVGVEGCDGAPERNPVYDEYPSLVPPIADRQEPE